MIYPDGPRNAETLMLDPLTKDIYIISKEGRARSIGRRIRNRQRGKNDTRAGCYQTSWGTATGGDISRDGADDYCEGLL